MRKLIVLSALLFLSASALAQAVELEGDISNVIVYRGQALVTRTIDVDLPEGVSELIVSNLPVKIVPESLYSQSPDYIKVISVRYRRQAVKEDTRQEVKDIDKQLEALATEHRHLCKQEDLINGRAKRFAVLWNFGVDATKEDFDNSKLQVQPVMELTEYIDKTIIGLHNERITVQDRKLEIDKEIALLKEKRKNLTDVNSKTNRQAVLNINKTSAGDGIIELSYLVDGANWSPQYNLRADAKNSSATIEYNAVVHQSSGEDWKNASVALSTAQPSLVAGSPVLNPMQITLTEIYNNRRPQMSVSSTSAVQPEDLSFDNNQAAQYSYVDRTGDFEQLLKERYSNISRGLTANKELNSLSVQNQIIELNADKKMQQQMQKAVAVIKRTEGVSVMYKLDGKLTMPSRSDQQLVNIAVIGAKADYLLVATPLLTDHVYLQAEILNDSDTILLPGTSSMYRNGEFVGKGSMELVTMGQKFVAGFGVDSQIKVTREFTDKKIETLWGNRVDRQQYSISINNYKNTPAKLCLMDRLPYTRNPNIEILVKDMSHQLSTDAEYVRTEKNKGLLRWDLDLKPNTTDSGATVIEYSYTLKYDNDMTIHTIQE